MSATDTTELPASYLASPDHPARFVELYRDLRRSRRPTGGMRFVQVAFASFFLALLGPLVWSAIQNRHPAPLALPVLFGSIFVFAFLRSRGGGIVVDDRGVHLAVGERTGAAFLPAADIVRTRTFDRWNADWARSIRMLRYQKADRAGPALGVELHTPAGPKRVLIGTAHPDALRAAVEEARATGVRPWLELDEIAQTRADADELDVEVRRDGSDLLIEARGVHLEGQLRIRPASVTRYRITRDPAYLQELRARRDDRLSRYGGGFANRRNRRVVDRWRMSFCGARTAGGAVEVIMDLGDGLPFTAVISTDHPERVASEIDRLVRATGEEQDR